jgi:hypothetical protein
MTAGKLTFYPAPAPVRYRSRIRILWHWTYDGRPPSRGFPALAECVADARAHGFFDARSMLEERNDSTVEA